MGNTGNKERVKWRRRVNWKSCVSRRDKGRWEKRVLYRCSTTKSPRKIHYIHPHLTIENGPVPAPLIPGSQAYQLCKLVLDTEAARLRAYSGAPLTEEGGKRVHFWRGAVTSIKNRGKVLSCVFMLKLYDVEYHVPRASRPPSHTATPCPASGPVRSTLAGPRGPPPMPRSRDYQLQERMDETGERDEPRWYSTAPVPLV